MPVKAMRYGIWTRWAAAAVFASLAACTAEEWAQFNKEMEQNQRAAAERRVKYRKIRVQCSDWEMADTAAASLSSKGFRVMYPGEDGYGAVATGRKLAEYQGESVPSESFHRMEAARSACRKAIGKMPSSTSIYW